MGKYSSLKRPLMTTVSVTAGLVLLAGCGTQQNATTGSTSNSITFSASNPVTITYATWFSTRYAVMQKIAAQFNKTHPGIIVKVEHEPADNSMLTKLLSELAAGDAPNVAGMWGPWAQQLASTPGVLPLNSFIAKDHYDLKQFYQDNVNTFTVKGKVIGLPADNDNMGVFYNKALFQKYNVPYPTANWTWAEMVHDAQLLNHPTQKNYGFLTFIGNTEGVTWRYEPFLWQLGGHLTNPQHTKAAFDSAAGVKVLNFYHQLAQYSDVVARSQYENAFQSGRVAMTEAGSWDIGSFTQSKVDFGAVPLPSPTAGGPHTSVAGPDINVILKSTPAQEQASWEFLKYLDNQQNAALQASLGHLPFRKDVVQSPDFAATLKKYPALTVFADNAANARLRPVFSAYANLSQDLGTAIESVLLKKLSPQQALQQAAQQADQQLAQSTP